MRKYRLLSIDPGPKQIGIALIENGRVTGLSTRKDVGHIQQDVVEAAASILPMAKNLDGTIADDVIIVIEIPAARYYGKGNSTDLMKLWHQILFLTKEFMAAGCNVLHQNSYDWNKKNNTQYTDKEKKVQFESITRSGFKSSNKDNRDAALMGLWVWNTIIN